MKRLTSVLLVIGLLLTGCGTSEQAAPNPQKVTSKGAIEGLSNVAWTFNTEPKATLSQPLVTEDGTYFGNDKMLYAVDTKEGNQKWTHAINGLPTMPALTGSTLVYNDNSGIHALSADNGEEVWNYDYNQSVPAGVKPKTTIVSSNHALIVEQSEDGRSSLKAVDIKTGKINWEYGNEVPLSGFVFSTDKLYVPMQGVVHIIDEKDGKEIDSLTIDAMISNIELNDDVLYAVDLGGHITSMDLKSKQQKWQYEIVGFEAPNAPALTVLKDKVVCTEVNSGSMIGIDAQTGKELWKTQLGDQTYRPILPGVITQPSVLGDTLYIGAWDGQDPEVKYMPDYSNLIAFNGNTGKELWRFKVDDYIMYPPAFADGKAIITNMEETITAFSEGKLPDQTDVEQTPAEEIDANNIKPSEVLGNSQEETDEKEFTPKDFEGDWKSKKQTFKLALTDSTSGTLTFHDDSIVPFEYVMPDTDSLMLKIGSEQKAAVIILYDSDTMGYRDNTLQDTLTRQQGPVDSANALISGFEGSWCDSLQTLCFRLELTDVNKGTLYYYQGRDPFKEQFEITYMDENSIDIRIEGTKQATMSLNSDKSILTYESDTGNETMTRQKD